MQESLIGPVTLQRGLLLSATVFVPVFGILYRQVAPDDYDPFAWRVVYAALSFLALVGSYVSPWLRERLHGVILVLAVVLDSAIIGLAGINGFSGDRSVGVVVTISCLVICFRNGWETLACGLFTVAIIAGAYSMGAESEVGQPVLQGCVVSVTAMIGLLNESRRRLQHTLESARAELEVRVAERTEALAHSMGALEGEIVVRRRAESEATAANRAKSAFLANMSHELRTPLNAIIGYTEILLEEAADRELPEFVVDLSRVRRAATHLLSMIGYILDLTAIEAGKLRIDAARVPLRPMLDDVEQTVRPLVEAGGNRAVWDCADDVVALADPERLRQILLNLMSNAAKFTDNGTVTLRARAEGERVRVTVSDTGVGIPEEALPSLFEEFVQVDGSSTKRFGGTGLGLAISRRLARALGGDVTVESRHGEGTTFTVDLPRWNDTERVVRSTPQNARRPTPPDAARR